VRNLIRSFSSLKNKEPARKDRMYIMKAREDKADIPLCTAKIEEIKAESSRRYCKRERVSFSGFTLLKKINIMMSNALMYALTGARTRAR